MHLDSNGWYEQDFAGESVPAACANAKLGMQRRCQVMFELDPHDLLNAYHELAYGAQLWATCLGRTQAVTNISLDRDAYEVEHWERMWVRAKDVTKLVGYKTERMEPGWP